MFTPVLAKHTKSFNLIDTLAVGVHRIQRSFEPMRRQVEDWWQAQITDDRAKLILYAAFVDGKLEAPRTLLPEVHRLYFQPEYEEFSPRTMWSLSNAFTSAFKELDPVPHFKAMAKLALSCLNYRRKPTVALACLHQLPRDGSLAYHTSSQVDARWEVT